jgi:hypothetical protein
MGARRFDVDQIAKAGRALVTADSTRSEDGARTSLNLCAGRVLTDEEWACARAKLLEFLKILRTWDQQTKMTVPETDNVVVTRVQELACQQEL